MSDQETVILSDSDDYESDSSEQGCNAPGFFTKDMDPQSLDYKLKLALLICRDVMTVTVGPTLAPDRLHTVDQRFVLASTLPSTTQLAVPSHDKSYRPSSPTYLPERHRDLPRRPVTPYPISRTVYNSPINRSRYIMGLPRSRRTTGATIVPGHLPPPPVALSEPQPSTSTGIRARPVFEANVLAPLREEDKSVFLDEMEVVELPVRHTRAYELVPSDNEENEMIQPRCITCLKRAPRMMFDCRHACFCFTCMKRNEFMYYHEFNAHALDCPFCRKKLPYAPIFL